LHAKAISSKEKIGKEQSYIARVEKGEADRLALME